MSGSELVSGGDRRAAGFGTVNSVYACCANTAGSGGGGGGGGAAGAPGGGSGTYRYRSGPSQMFTSNAPAAGSLPPQRASLAGADAARYKHIVLTIAIPSSRLLRAGGGGVSAVVADPSAAGESVSERAAAAAASACAAWPDSRVWSARASASVNVSVTLELFGSQLPSPGVMSTGWLRVVLRAGERRETRQHQQRQHHGEDHPDPS